MIYLELSISCANDLTHSQTVVEEYLNGAGRIEHATRRKNYLKI